VSCKDKGAAPCAALDEASCRARPDCQGIYSSAPPTADAGCVDGDAGISVPAADASLDPRSDPRSIDAGPVPSLDAGSPMPALDGGPRGDFLFCANRNSCPPIACGPCPKGSRPVLDAQGCDTCRCEPTACPEPVCTLYCPNGPVKDDAGCDTCRCKPDTCPDVLCALACPNGFIKDENGCDTCKCRPPVCPPLMCPAMVCPWGADADANGCNTCQCRPAPCFSDAQCPPGEVCEVSAIACPTNAPCPKPVGICVAKPTPYCSEDEQCPPGEVCSVPLAKCPPGAMCPVQVGTCEALCTTDADCAQGTSCQPDPSDPCNGPAVDCFRKGRTVCLPKLPPPPPYCTSDAQCPAGQVCSAPPFKCPPGAMCPQVVGRCQSPCKADGDCAGGLTCQPDPNDPCNSDPTVRCFAPGRRTCQPPARSCAGLDEKSCLSTPGCAAVYGPSVCDSAGACTPDLVYQGCE
jgi:Cys-rich repeat protein